MRLRLPLTLAATVALGATVLVSAPAQAAGNTLTVDVGSTVRPVTHVAAGGLYGVDTGDKPPLDLLQPLHYNMFTQPPPGTQQLGNGATSPCCDALSVAGKVTSAGAQQYIRLPDIFSAFPYNWVSWSDWEAKVRGMVDARVKATGTTNIAGYEIWNEPDCNWSESTKNDPNAGPFLDAWTKTYGIIRSVDKVTPIVGPGTCVYNHDWMLAFMTNAKNTGTLPQTAVWHELQDFSYNNVQSHVDDFRAIENSLGLPHVPISINEYASPDQVDIPSIGVHYMASLERAGIHDGERAYWYEAGTLDGLLWDNKPTASYWPYKWYGDMAGNVVKTTPQSYLDGVAAYDSTRKVVNVVFGGDSGSNTVKVNGLGALGGSVKVTLSSTPGTGRKTNVAAPTTVSSTTYTVNNGSISVPVGGMDAAMGYQLLITPAAGPTSSWQQTYEAENATVVNAKTYASGSASNGSYVGTIDNSGDARSDSFVDFLVNVPSARSYTMDIRYANGTGAPATQGLAYNGGAWSTVSYPATGAWGSFGSTVRTTLNLKAGYNTIRLAKGSPGFAGGTGFAEIDSITLS